MGLLYPSESSLPGRQVSHSMSLAIVVLPGRRIALHFDGRLGELPNLEGKPFHPLARRRDIFVCGDAKSVVRPNAAFGLAWRAWSR